MRMEKESLSTDRPWEPSIRADWAEATPEELLNEIIRLRRGMDGVRSRSLCGHHKAAEDLHCWTWNGNDPNEWKPDYYGRDDERAHQEQASLERLLRDFEAITPRRVTQTTVVYERPQLDAWRQKCGEALYRNPRHADGAPILAEEKQAGFPGSKEGVEE